MPTPERFADNISLFSKLALQLPDNIAATDIGHAGNFGMKPSIATCAVLFAGCFAHSVLLVVIEWDDMLFFFNHCGFPLVICL